MNSRIKTVRQVLVLILLVAFCILLSSCGKKQKVYRVGIIGGVKPFIGISDGFRSKMSELGYIDGKNIIYDVQVANLGRQEQSKILNNFLAEKVDLIFAFPTEPALEAKQVFKGTNIPVVFAIAGIEQNNLIDSVRNPGGNITGVRYPGPDLVVKRFEILLELAPHIKRLLIPYNPDYPICLPSLQALRPVASNRGVTLVEKQIRSLEEIEAAFKGIHKNDNIDAIQILPELLTQSPDVWKVISEFAKENKLPLVGSMLSSADNGGVFSYCVDFFEVGKLAAPIADKILKGTSAGTISVVSPEAHLRINYKTAKELNLNIPEGLLSRADEIIR